MKGICNCSRILFMYLLKQRRDPFQINYKRAQEIQTKCDAEPSMSTVCNLRVNYKTMGSNRIR
uniref:Uncharacterized protein n=1 Tax=Megaselia scalaris TaxID=36166 RepID=T1GEY5_MEGSC